MEIIDRLLIFFAGLAIGFILTAVFANSMYVGVFETYCKSQGQKHYYLDQVHYCKNKKDQLNRIEWY